MQKKEKKPQHATHHETGHGLTFERCTCVGEEYESSSSEDNHLFNHLAL